MSYDPGHFSVHVHSSATQTVIEVSGDLDHSSAPSFAAVLDQIVEAGHPGLVLDLTDLTSMDASGMRVIADAAARVHASGEAFALRLDTDAAMPVMPGSAPLGGGRQVHEALGPEQLADDGSSTVIPGLAGLSADLVRVGSGRAADDVIDAALGLVTTLASATVDGADGVSVTLERRGQLQTVAATNAIVLQMDSYQYETGEGPCLSAAAHGHWFHVESATEEQRWPEFLALARTQGIASILSTPLLSSRRPIGALNIYANTERAFGPPQQELAALFASQASGILASGGDDVTDEQLGNRIAQALSTRTTIAQAEGVLMALQHLSADEAAAEMHHGARASMIPVVQYAAAVLASTRRPRGTTE